MPSRLRRYDEVGHTHFWTISCYRRLQFFHDFALRKVVLNALEQMRRTFRICLIGYVIMPEHVHVIVYPHPEGEATPVSVARLLQSFKQHVGDHGKQYLRQVWRSHGCLWSQPLQEWARGALGKQSLWETRGYDFNINRQETLIEKLNYCHKNPLTRGLVQSPEQWAWSSFRYYEGGGEVLLPMDWDGRWPIEW